MMSELSVTTARVNDFEGFREAVHGSHVDVMQLERGKLRGSLTHVGIGNFSLSVGSFSAGIRTQRTSKEQKLIYSEKATMPTMRSSRILAAT